MRFVVAHLLDVLICFLCNISLFCALLVSQSVKAAILKCSYKQARHLKFMLYVNFVDRHLVIEKLFFIEQLELLMKMCLQYLWKKMFTDTEERREEAKKDISLTYVT